MVDKKMFDKKLILTGALAVLVAAAFLVMVPAASASVIGRLDVANCSGGGVIVTGTTIDWSPPLDALTGCVQTGTATNITYSGGTLSAGVLGTILDLTPANPLPVTDFLTFASAPTLHFDLTGLGPGPSNTACVSSFNPNTMPCAVFLGSPVLLQSTATGTTVTLSAFGIARDGTLPASSWQGAFTTQIASVTPAQIQAAILAGGAESSTFSGDFILTVVPEPAPAGMFVLGGLLTAAGVFRRKVRR